MTALDTLPIVRPRPFYGEFAWAYDYLVPRPVAEECAGMAASLARRGVGPGAALLDAGCGTGRYTVELGRRGFVVTGVDRASALLDEAWIRVREAGAGVRVRIERGDLRSLPAGPVYDAVVCRGVLNDFVDASARAAVFEGFARALRAGGVLLLDVRDWDATAAGKTAQPVVERRVSTPRGLLVFRSETRLDRATRRMLISERHTLTTGAGETTAAYDFVMQCWTREELRAGLGAAGFEAVEYAAAYDGAPSAGGGDRIVVAASRGARPERSA